MTTPVTQQLAYANIRARLGTAQFRVWEFLQTNGPHTRNELDRAIGAGQPNSNASRRLAELIRMGVIIEGPPRTCRISGHLCTQYLAAVVEPRALTRRPSKLARALDALATMERTLAGPAETLIPDPRVGRALAVARETLAEVRQ